VGIQSVDRKAMGKDDAAYSERIVDEHFGGSFQVLVGQVAGPLAGQEELLGVEHGPRSKDHQADAGGHVVAHIHANAQGHGGDDKDHDAGQDEDPEIGGEEAGHPQTQQSINNQHTNADQHKGPGDVSLQDVQAHHQQREALEDAAEYDPVQREGELQPPEADKGQRKVDPREQKQQDGQAAVGRIQLGAPAVRGSEPLQRGEGHLEAQQQADVRAEQAAGGLTLLRNPGDRSSPLHILLPPHVGRPYYLAVGQAGIRLVIGLWAKGSKGSHAEIRG